MVSLVFEIVNGHLHMQLLCWQGKKESRVDPFPSGDPARAAVELVNSVREQEHGQLEVQVTIGVVLKDELRYT